MAEQPPILEKARARVTEIRDRMKTRIEEWRARGWRTAPAGTQREPLFPRLKEIREKGLISRVRTERRLLRTQRKREVEPAYPKTRAVKEEAEITPTVGKREIAIEI